MSKAYVDIDFFQMEKRNNASSKPSSPERAPSSFRGIQRLVSRINPQLLKTVMAAGDAGHARSSHSISAWSTSSDPPSPSRTTSPPPLPVYNPASRCSICPVTDTAPLTIFYNGTVTTFDVPREKAEAIMRMADTGVVENPAEKPEGSSLYGNRIGDVPMARRKSLQSFLEKRKERLAWASPYYKVIPSRLCEDAWRGPLGGLGRNGEEPPASSLESGALLTETGDVLKSCLPLMMGALVCLDHRRRISVLTAERIQSTRNMCHKMGFIGDKRDHINTSSSVLMASRIQSIADVSQHRSHRR